MLDFSKNNFAGDTTIYREYLSQSASQLKLLKTIIDKVYPKPEAKFLTFHCSGGTYSESRNIKKSLAPDIIIAYTVDGKLLERKHGAPLRLVVPGLWGYKRAKWIERVEFARSRHLGYWEQRGYGPDSGPEKKKTKDRGIRKKLMYNLTELDFSLVLMDSSIPLN